jgi:hypothetical protein
VSLFRGKVNAHLRKAEALLEQFKAVQADEGSRLTQDALIEGCSFQLQLAKRNFLREIAENYQSPEAAEIASAQDLAAALEKIDKLPAELSEILTSEQEGWMAQMQAAHSQLVSGSTAGKGSAALQSAGLIQTKELSSNDLDFARVESWLLNLKELVERQREMMVEC